MPKGDSLSPRQVFATLSHPFTKGVKMKLKIKANSFKRKAQKLSLKLKMSTMSDNEVALAIRKSSDGFLESKEWKDLRLIALEKYGLVCMCCGRDNSRKFPINVDHVKPRKFFPELALDITNLQVLCGPCNKRKGNKTIDYRT